MSQKITAKKSGIKRIIYLAVFVFAVITLVVFLGSANQPAAQKTSSSDKQTDEQVEFSFGPGPEENNDNDEDRSDSSQGRLKEIDGKTYEEIEGDFYDKKTRYSSPEEAIESWVSVNGYTPFSGPCLDNPKATAGTICWYLTVQGYEITEPNETERGFRRVFVDFDDNGFWVSDSFPTGFFEDPKIR